MPDFEFGNRITHLRVAKGLTQAELGEQLGVSDKAVSKWENGRSKPRMEICAKLAHALDVTLDELMNGKGRKPDADQRIPLRPDGLLDDPALQLKSERLTIAAMTEADKEEFMAVMKFIPEELGLEDSNIKLDQQILEQLNNSTFESYRNISSREAIYAIRLADGGRIIGFIVLNQSENDPPTIEVADLNKPFPPELYDEAFRLFTDHLARDRGVKRIYTHVSLSSADEIKAIERRGGRFRRSESIVLPEAWESLVQDFGPDLLPLLFVSYYFDLTPAEEN